ncbi:hypothetical protein B0H11DRAFT_1942997 [Mycena galericulata]|nr:hypothetical protein B0H11DRAFT_1942997 [Mycena galericulata]
MYPFENFAYHMRPQDLTRMLTHFWGEIGDACSDWHGEWPMQHIFRTTLMGQVVAVPAETTTARMTLGLPSWERKGWGANDFLCAFTEQARILNFLDKVAVRCAKAAGLPVPAKRGNYDIDFDVLLDPSTICVTPGRYNLLAHSAWEDVESPFHVGDTLIIAVTLDIAVPQGVVIRAQEVQRVFALHRGRADDITMPLPP